MRSADMQGYTLKVYGLDCAEEVSALEKVLIPVVKNKNALRFDLLNGKLTIESVDSSIGESDLVAAIAKAGLKAVAWEQYLQDSQQKTGFWPRYGRLILAIISGLALILGYVINGMQYGFLTALAGHESLGWALDKVAISSFIVAIIAGGRYVFPKALIALKGYRADINVLMTIAVIGAVLIAQWVEAAAVTFLFSVALLLENWSVGRARNAIKSLLEIAPDTARTVCAHHGVDEKPVAEVKIGAIVIVRPGEKIPLDGVITQGQTHVNQAPITGESMAVLKKTGDALYAGTINEEGVIEFKVTRSAEQTTLAQIIKRVEEAQAYRANSEQWVEKFARYYTPAMMVLALLVAVVPPLFFSALWSVWIYEALVILVIACPCALVISTPVSIVSGLSAAARSGVLVKGGAYLEQPAKLDVIALDKTGTLTEGQPEVQRLYAVNGFSEEKLLTVAAALEAESEHPLAVAVLRKAAMAGITVERAVESKAIKGKGVEGYVEGEYYWLGSHRFLHEKKQCSDSSALHELIMELESAGHSILALGTETAICGVISVADQVREASQRAIRQLKALGLKTVLLSGDNQGTADAVGQLCEIDEVHAELLPEDKVSVIKALHGKNHCVAMIGDGINDAPALVTADLGIAMGAVGSDAAIEAADIALMSDELEKLPWLIGHSRRVMQVIKQNISFAIGVKVIFIALALAGVASLWLAVAADIGVSLLVIFNALRLLKPSSLV
ncbi:heavy metal translocating P-type ATPase [Piscirickettsia salmonis]|uniref:heavy metal translocating P-type ATPase n=1 Tax=Piscirickettsia salmonis TaxID=1238 RepID=UPI00118773F2|nr:heavy metal translocating P-type ATPase [Piscirickettsia salmonis]QHS24846.1 heavy metal translocating P-type ATPase [Piscirickettsia salmonis]QHS28051.1 heavy metal translocating P-type ATPase [Piscirickettsia salmonis]